MAYIEIKGLKVDPALFTVKFNCLCDGECCEYGVYADIKEREAIEAITPQIVAEMDDTQTADTSKWFEEPGPDEDFPSGIATGTEVHNNKCVFLDGKGLCSVQKVCMKSYEHKWKFKPFYCILFPIYVYKDVLTYDNEHLERLKTCNKKEVPVTPLAISCREEIEHVIGADGYEELMKYSSTFASYEDPNKLYNEEQE